MPPLVSPVSLSPPPVGRLLLAPMEGLADDVLREILTDIGGYDLAVTEFVRVTNTCLPPRTFQRISPELKNGGRTRAGTPVWVQLLGGEPEIVARNAAALARLEPPGIDLNFGCPAPAVNRHRGGAALLDEPELLLCIARAVRTAVPPAIPVGAKMRLGIVDTSRALDCARALDEGGIQSLVVHARTKIEMYRPPAHWEWIARIRAEVRTPVVANGEVWNAGDYHRCRAVSGAADVMLGRGAVADPFLVRRLRQGGVPDRVAEWEALRPHLARFWVLVRAKVEPRHAPGRLKLWLGLLRRNYPAAEALYAAIRPLRHCDEVERTLAQNGIPVPMSDSLSNSTIG